MGLVVVILIAVGVVAYFVNSLLSGGAKDQMIAAASKSLKTKVDFQSYGLDFGSLIKLTPAVRISGLTIANPQGYSARNMIEAQEVAASLDLRAVMDKRIVVRSLDIQSPKILIETGAGGKTNLETILSNLDSGPTQQASAAPAAADAGTDVSVGEILMSHGTVTLASAQKPQPEVMFRDFQLTMSNLAANQACNLDLNTQLFEAGTSQLKVAGKAGPFGKDSLPIDAKASVALPLAEIPAKTRQIHFGDLAADPGKDSRIATDVALQGDLYKVATGTGQLKIDKFLVGPAGQQNRLTLNGTAPLTLKAVDLMSGDEFELQAPKATFSLGAGTWNGNLLLQRKSERLSGNLNGAIQNVDVNQMMTSFAGSPNKVYGTLAIPGFDLRFSGANSDELQRSLAGQGKLTVSNGKFQGLSVLSGIEKALGGGQGAQDGAFAQFATNFNLQKQNIALTGISATGPGVVINGQGNITFTKALNFNLQTKLTGAAADRIRGLSQGFVSGDLVIPVQVAGTLDNPQVRPEMKGLAKSAATNAVQGVLNNFLNKKKK